MAECTKQDHAALSSYGDGHKNLPRYNDVNQSSSSPEMELEQETEIDTISGTSLMECIGAARSPWAKDIIDHVDDQNHNHESNSILSLLEMNDLSSTPNYVIMNESFVQEVV